MADDLRNNDPASPLDRAIEANEQGQQGTQVLAYRPYAARFVAGQDIIDLDNHPQPASLQRYYWRGRQAPPPPSPPRLPLRQRISLHQPTVEILRRLGMLRPHASRGRHAGNPSADNSEPARILASENSTAPANYTTPAKTPALTNKQTSADDQDSAKKAAFAPTNSNGQVGDSFNSAATDKQKTDVEVLEGLAEKEANLDNAGGVKTDVEPKITKTLVKETHERETGIILDETEAVVSDESMIENGDGDVDEANINTGVEDAEDADVFGSDRDTADESIMEVKDTKPERQVQKEKKKRDIKEMRRVRKEFLAQVPKEVWRSRYTRRFPPPPGELSSESDLAKGKKKRKIGRDGTRETTNPRKRRDVNTFLRPTKASTHDTNSRPTTRQQSNNDPRLLSPKRSRPLVKAPRAETYIYHDTGRQGPTDGQVRMGGRAGNNGSAMTAEQHARLTNPPNRDVVLPAMDDDEHDGNQLPLQPTGPSPRDPIFSNEMARLARHRG